MRKLTIALALLTACSGTPAPRKAADLKVESVILDLDGRTNSLGATSRVDVRNPSMEAAQWNYRVIYLSHTGAELLEMEPRWQTLELAAGERRVLEHSCPFRTAKQARLELQ